MCPIFRATHDEAATPRAKANLMRHLLQRGSRRPAARADEVRAVADLCVNCKMCASECPAHVNIPQADARSQGRQRRRARPGPRRLGLGPASKTSLALGQRGLVRGQPRAAQPHRPLAAREALRRVAATALAAASPPQLPGPGQAARLDAQAERLARPRVAYFVDVFANYNDPLIAEATVAVLHHNGIEVYVPPGQRGCGMAPLCHGDVETAREIGAAQPAPPGRAAREGWPILCSEPTAALMLRQDALDLLDDADARLVAEQTVEFTAFLWDLHQRGPAAHRLPAARLSARPSRAVPPQGARPARSPGRSCWR